jgi:hypothetical protein
VPVSAGWVKAVLKTPSAFCPARFTLATLSERTWSRKAEYERDAAGAVFGTRKV